MAKPESSSGTATSTTGKANEATVIVLVAEPSATVAKNEPSNILPASPRKYRAGWKL